MPYHSIIFWGYILLERLLVKLALIYLQKNGDLQYHGEIISISAGLSVSHMILMSHKHFISSVQLFLDKYKDLYCNAAVK